MKWNSKYVREKYGIHMLGQHGMYYPCSAAKRLIVVFSSMGKDRYDRYSWFWQEDEHWIDSAYLFLKDDSFHYFLGTDERPLSQSFRKIILHHMSLAGVTEDQVFTIGGSMGGYAAIYYASLMQLNGAVVTNPQLDYASTRAHSYSNWERQIREIGSQWYDLGDFIFKWPHIPNIYIEYGNYRADSIAAEKFISAARVGPSLVIVRKADWEDHTVDSLSKKTIESAIFFFENHGFGGKRPRPRDAGAEIGAFRPPKMEQMIEGDGE
jgi:pimeloyl-ACP methyl ester carboxylesterase